MEIIKNKLCNYTPISLSEMDNVKLMDRTDTKFTFAFDKLPDILDALLNNYRVLIIDGVMINRYETLYFDTPDLLMYNLHQSGKLNRHKIRHRTYVESNIGFLEVKFKNNKGRTFKSRIKENEVCYDFKTKQIEFIQKKTPYNCTQLKPTIWVNYSRITLVNKTSAERLTIDINLEFKKDNITKTFNQLVIAEVKRDSKSNSPFVDVMKKLHLREGSISKYCLAVAVSFPDVKKNNFKEKIINLKNLINYDSSSNS